MQHESPDLPCRYLLLSVRCVFLVCHFLRSSHISYSTSFHLYYPILSKDDSVPKVPMAVFTTSRFGLGTLDHDVFVGTLCFSCQ